MCVLCVGVIIYLNLKKTQSSQRGWARRKYVHIFCFDRQPNYYTITFVMGAMFGVSESNVNVSSAGVYPNLALNYI